MKVPHLWCDSHTSFKVKGQRSRSAGPLMLTHIVRHIFWTARPTNFKLSIQMEDDDPRCRDLQCQGHTRPINGDTHRSPYLPNGKAYKLKTWYTDGGRRSLSAIGAMSSKVKGQGHIRPINADTNCPPYLPNGKAYELQTWYTDGGRQPASVTGAMTFKVKGHGRNVMWSVWAVLTQCCSCVIRGRTQRPHFLFIIE